MGNLASIAFGIIFTASVISWVVTLAGNGETSVPPLVFSPSLCRSKKAFLSMLPWVSGRQKNKTCPVLHGTRQGAQKVCIIGQRCSRFYCGFPGALNAVCLDACRYYFGLSWWTIWFEFIILLATIPVGVSPYCLFL